MKPAKKKLSSLKIKQQALYILIFSFVTVIIWISGSLFTSQRKTGIAPNLLELAIPLSPTINVNLIDSIEQSPNYSDQELANFQIFKLIKNKDGTVQKVVPIESNLDEISEEEIEILVKNNQQQQNISNQSNLGEQIESGEGTFDTQTESLTQPVSPPSSDIVVPPASPGFGEDGRFYLD